MANKHGHTAIVELLYKKGAYVYEQGQVRSEDVVTVCCRYKEICVCVCSGLYIYPFPDASIALF